MKKRLMAWLALLIVGILCTSMPAQAAPRLLLSQFGDNGLQTYLNAATADTPWTLLAAIDQVETGRMDWGDPARLTAIKQGLGSGTLEQRLRNYGGSDLYAYMVMQDMERLSNAEAILGANQVFPLAPESGYVYENTWGASRTYGGARPHLGIDLIVDKGTPIRSISAGTVTRKGWDEKGGWRIGVTDAYGIYYYYAHLSAYAQLEIGDTVTPGQVLGYVGSTGYGPEGTDNVMIPHLHIGMYESDVAINPYPFLLTWEKTAR